MTEDLKTEGSHPEKIDILERDLPSKLRNPKTRLVEIKQRILVLRDFAAHNNIFAPEQFAEDEHFWYTALINYLPITKMFHKHIPEVPKPLRQKLAVALTIRDAEQQVLKDQEKLTDGLTGAWSRKAIDNFLENLLQRPRRAEVGLLFFDIDHFKAFNDRVSHAKGDTVLKDLVRELTYNTRLATDMVGRYGGDEYAVVIPTMESTDSIVIKAEQLRETVAQKLEGVTVSIGVAIMSRDERTIDDLYNRADRGLYAAKRLGRNRSVMLNEFASTGHAIFTDLSTGIKHKEIPLATLEGTTEFQYVKIK